jgi:hypothetical protein
MRVFNHVRLAFVGLAMAGLAACSEAPSAPTMAEADGASFAKGGAPGRELPDSGQASFWYVPQFGVWGSLGQHSLVMPANTLCDPATSKYGVEYWDEPCDLAVRPVRITVRWFLKDNQSHVTFTPDLRFVPTSDPNRWVTLSMKQERGTVSDESTILWWDQTLRTWVDEGTTDPTLAPWVDRGGNRVTRRVKHFSGYVVGTFCETDCGSSGSGEGM